MADERSGIGISRGWSLFCAALVIAAGFACGGAGQQEQRKIVVYAAASTTELLEDAAAQFTAESGIQVVFEFGSSGSLAKKIEAGSPTDIFVSANEKWIEYADEKGLLKSGSILMFASNTLVFIEPINAPSGISTPEGLAEVTRICIGDPGFVPAGQYARESLEYYGLWDGMINAEKLVLATDVRAVTSLVEQGEVTGGIVFSTDVLHSRNARIVFPLPDDSHQAITYHAGAVAASTAVMEAVKFIEFLGGEKFGGLLEKHGFKRP